MKVVVTLRLFVGSGVQGAAPILRNDFCHALN